MSFICYWGQRLRGLFNFRSKRGDEEKLIEKNDDDGSVSEWDDLCWECIAEKMTETGGLGVVERGRNELFRCARCDMETDVFVNDSWWRQVAVEERSSLQSPLPVIVPVIVPVIGV